MHVPDQLAELRKVLQPAVWIGRQLLQAIGVLIFLVLMASFALALSRGMPLVEALVTAPLETVGYLQGVLAGNLGLTSSGSITLRPLPVSEVVPVMLLRSFALLGASLLLATVVGASLGFIASARRHSRTSVGFLLLSLIGVSLPSFLAALLLQLGVIFLTKQTGNRILPVGGFGWDSHIVLPAIVLAARPIAQIFRVTYIRVGEVLDRDYVRTAHSIGLHPNRVFWQHVLRNAAIPILTTIGLSLRFALSSLPVVEFFFGWQGVGFYLLKSVARQDDNLTFALLLGLGVFFMVVNLLLEVSYLAIDPKVREQTRLARFHDREGLKEVAIAAYREVLDFAQNSKLARFILRLRTGEEGPRRKAQGPVTRQAERDTRIRDELPHAQSRRRTILRRGLTNPPLILGIVLLIAVAVAFFFGPSLSPLSPYTQRGLQIIDGEFRVPPLSPDGQFLFGTDALGRDMLSLILAGTHQTVKLALFVVAARLAVGLFLGSIAGWLSGSWFDRAVMGLSEAIAAFPTLVLAMLFILALGIRQGIYPFVVGLGLVGWGEVMQFVRASVLSIKPKLFVESASALGARSPRIIQRHIFPNLIPMMISTSALEMGSVLMLLGELGFIGIFIGGGAFAELDIFGAPYHYSDVPEWGALLSNVRTYAQSYPWMALFPALAFFVAILGFNLFGDGLRRMVEKGRLRISMALNRYTLLALAVAVLSIGWFRENTGAVAFYRNQAREYQADQAYEHIVALTSPEMEGRAVGTNGASLAAEYIAAQFEALGLQPAGETFSYFHSEKREFEVLQSQPILEISGSQTPLQYRQDYREYAGDRRNLGEAEGPVHLLLTGPLTRSSSWGSSAYPALEGLDYSDKILLVLNPGQLDYLNRFPRLGTLVVAEGPADLPRLETLHSVAPSYNRTSVHDDRLDAPTILISEEVGDALLADSGQTVAGLREMSGKLAQDQVFQIETGRLAALHVDGEVQTDVPAVHVIGHMPSTVNLPDLGDDGKHEMVMVLAQYDCPPAAPTEIEYTCANDNAAGIALMLETIRTLVDSGYQNYRTLLFIAYSGEGIQGGRRMDHPDPSTFLQAKYGFSTSFRLEAVIRIRAPAAGTGEAAQVAAGGSARLSNLIRRTSRHMDLRLEIADEEFDVAIVYEDQSASESAAEAPELLVSWAGWEVLSRTPADTIDTIDTENLERIGEALTEFLMIIGRENNY